VESFGEDIDKVIFKKNFGVEWQKKYEGLL